MSLLFVSSVDFFPCRNEQYNLPGIILNSAYNMFNVDILSPEMKVINQGEVTLVFLKRDNNRLTTAPQELIDCFEK